MCGVRRPGRGSRPGSSGRSCRGRRECVLRSGRYHGLAPTAAFLTVLFAAPLQAQYAHCGDPIFSPNTMAACQAAVDAARAFQPLAGIAVSGGNATLGANGALGGLGHFAIATRVNGVGASIPDPDRATSSSIPSQYRGVIPAPSVEVAAGLPHRFDLQGSAVLLPTGIVNRLSIGPGSPHVGSIALGLGLGVRAVVLRPRLSMPSISVSVMRRWMPEVRYGVPPDTTQPNRYHFSANLRADNYRVHAGWRLAGVDLGTGLGVDHYHSRVRAGGTVSLGGISDFDTGPFTVGATRAVLFIDAALHLASFHVAGELGYQTGKNQTFNTHFADFDPTAGHRSGGLGLRLGL